MGVNWMVSPPDHVTTQRRRRRPVSLTSGWPKFTVTIMSSGNRLHFWLITGSLLCLGLPSSSALADFVTGFESDEGYVGAPGRPEPPAEQAN